MRRRHALLLTALPLATRAGDRVLRYARQGNPEADFFFVLLRDLLEQEGPSWRLLPTDERLSHARALREVERGGGAVDIVWTMTSHEREQRLQPVRIPIDGGCFGWRVLLVRRGESARFAGVRSLEELRAFRYLQGHDWPDASILAANGLAVERSSNFESLFAMLAAGRADALPRSAVEVADELRRYADGYALELEPSLVLRYATAVYYFVSPQRPDLAAMLERGLRRLIASGRWSQLLEQHHGRDLRLAQLDQRRIVRLHNPQLPAATPLGDAALWWKPR